MDSTLTAQIIDMARWAIPPIIGYLIWVHREILTLRHRLDNASERITAHDQSSAVIAQQLSALTVMMARLEERINLFLRRGGA